MVDSNHSVGAPISFPISAPALQSASLQPDFNYFDITAARKFNASLGQSNPFFSADELFDIGLLGNFYLALIASILATNPLPYIVEISINLLENASGGIS